MARFKGGARVNHGFYWSARGWDMAMIPAEGGLLPGGPGSSYVHVPTFLFLLMAPLMGALYVVFLPFVGFAMVLGYAVRGVKRMATDAFMNIAVAVSPHWAPGEAYLASRRRARDEHTSERTSEKGE